jgi:hypothetical protein
LRASNSRRAWSRSSACASAQWQSVLSGSITLAPISVSWYSTRGGTVGYTFLEINPSRSIPRRVCVNTFGEILVMACCNVMARWGPGVRRCKSVMRHLSDSNSTASRDCKARPCKGGSFFIVSSHAKKCRQSPTHLEIRPMISKAETCSSATSSQIRAWNKSTGCSVEHLLA